MTADADGEVRRTHAAARLVAHEPLHDPVLERVEGDDGEPAARSKHPHRIRKRRLERAELVVHGDPQSLEDTPGGMAVPEPAGVGMAPLITSTSSPVRVIACFLRVRPIARAICVA